MTCRIRTRDELEDVSGRAVVICLVADTSQSQRLDQHHCNNIIYLCASSHQGLRRRVSIKHAIGCSGLPGCLASATDQILQQQKTMRPTTKRRMPASTYRVASLYSMTDPRWGGGEVGGGGGRGRGRFKGEGEVGGGKSTSRRRPRRPRRPGKRKVSPRCPNFIII